MKADDLSKPGRAGRFEPWMKELEDFARALNAAFLLGIPLLYTLEMWRIGEDAHPEKLLLFLLIAFGINTVLVHYCGFKKESTFRSSLAQAVEAVAVGVVASLILLLILNRIRPGEMLQTILGKVIIQAAPLSLGASIANTIFSSWAHREWADDGPDDRSFPARTARAVFATVTGGLFVGLTIAPTEEIHILAAEATPGHMLALIGFTLLVTYSIVFEAEFNHHGHRRSEGLPGPLSETALAYVVSLAVAAVGLFLFHQIDWGDPLRTVVSEVLVLGLPVSIGGAAGRLVL